MTSPKSALRFGRLKLWLRSSERERILNSAKLNLAPLWPGEGKIRWIDLVVQGGRRKFEARQSILPSLQSDPNPTSCPLPSTPRNVCQIKRNEKILPSHLTPTLPDPQTQSRPVKQENNQMLTLTINSNPTDDVVNKIISKTKGQFGILR